MAYYIKSNPRKATFIWWPKSLNRIENKEAYQYLQSRFKRYGYDLQTQDKHPPKDSDIVIWGYPRGDLQEVSDKTFLVGWLMESPISLRQPLRRADYQKFDLILTYRRDLIDNKKSFFVRIFTRIDDVNTSYWHTPKTTLVTQVASCEKGGEYEERKVATKWFLENAPQDFKLYGLNWDGIKKELSRKAAKAFEQRYNGWVDDKLKVVSESKFVLAYENAIQNDYVTEKIYDVLQAGSVPVYLGADNIDNYVPSACFIDKNDFETYDELYDFLKHMDDATYEAYRQCSYRFIQQKQLRQSSIVDRVVYYIFDKKKKDLYDWCHKLAVAITDL